jgi:hypothetical protein
LIIVLKQEVPTERGVLKGRITDFTDHTALQAVAVSGDQRLDLGQRHSAAHKLHAENQNRNRRLSAPGRRLSAPGISGQQTTTVRLFSRHLQPNVTPLSCIACGAGVVAFSPVSKLCCALPGLVGLDLLVMVLMLDRRKILKGLLVSTSWRGLVSAPFAIALLRSARAEPFTIAIAIVAAVAGMIASNNAGGGGLGDFLNAINKKLDIAIDQLASLQEAVSAVLQKLANLDTEIESALHNDDLRRLHDLTYSAVLRYASQILPVRKQYNSDVDYRKSPGALADIQSILNDLSSATAQLQAKQAYGPTTGMVIPAAFFLENSLLLLRGDKPVDIAARLQSSVDWLDRVADPAAPASAASYRALAVLRHQQFWEAASKNKFGEALAMKPGSTLFECVSVKGWYYRQYSGGGSRGSVQLLRTDDPQQNAIFKNVTLTEKEYFAPVIVEGQKKNVPCGFNALYLNQGEPSKVLPIGSPELPSACPNAGEVSEGIRKSGPRQASFVVR